MEIHVYMKDLKPEKQMQIFDAIDSPDLHIDSYLFSIRTFRNGELNVDGSSKEKQT